MALTLETILDHAAQAGQQSAAGVDSMVHLGKLAFMGARASVVNATNVADVYMAYLKAANAGEFTRKAATDKDSTKSAITRLRRFVKFAGLPGRTDAMWTLVPRSVAIINQTEAKGPGGLYEQVQKVLKASIDAKKAGLTDDEILEAITPKVNERDEVQAALEALVKAANKYAEAESFILQSARFAAIRAVAQEQLEQYQADAVKRQEEQALADDDTPDLSRDSSEVAPTVREPTLDELLSGGDIKAAA
jgi:hypothetical protein